MDNLNKGLRERVLRSRRKGLSHEKIGMDKMSAFRAHGVARCAPGAEMNQDVQSVLEVERVIHNGPRSDQAWSS